MFQIYFSRGMKRRKEWHECHWCRILRKQSHTCFLSAFLLISSHARPTNHSLGAGAALPTPVNQPCPGKLSSTEAQQREAAGTHARTVSCLQAKASCSSAAPVLHNRAVWHLSVSSNVGVFTSTKITDCTCVPEVGFIKALTFSSWIHTILLRHKQCSKYKLHLKK